MKRFLKISLTFCVITSFFFAGCKNFMNGSGVMQELNFAIDYANAEKSTVLINSTDGSGSFLTGNGEKKLKVGDSVEVEFKVNDAWQFQKWIAVDKDNQSKNLTNYIKFSDSTSTKTTITLLTECENILVMPKCVERLKIASYLPDTKNEVPYNTDIFITFNYNISQSSITFSTQELENLGVDDSDELIKITQPINSEAVYGYKKNNITYFKNIEITSSSGENLNEYFNPPQLISGKTLLITKNDVPFIFDSTNKKTITVSVAADFSEKSGISVGTKGASFAYTINETSKVVEPTVKIDFSTEKEYGTIAPNSTIECSLQKDYDISFTETKDYKFVRWEAVYNDGTNDSAEDMVLIKDKTAKNTTFQLKYAIPGLVIKAICEKRPVIKEVYPQNLSSGLLRNSNIKITFSERMQDVDSKYLDFSSNECVVSLKDSNGNDLKDFYNNPVLNYDKTVISISANNLKPVPSFTRVVVTINQSVFMNEKGIPASDEPYSWEFTVGNVIDNTAPEIRGFRLSATEGNVHTDSEDGWFSLPNDEYPEFNPQNHAGKTIYGYINTYDNETRAKYLYVTETLCTNVNGTPITSEPYTGKQELQFETQIATDAYFSYTFNTSPDRIDGLYKLEFYVDDDTEDSLKKQSEVITYYVVKDTIGCDLSEFKFNGNYTPHRGYKAESGFDSAGNSYSTVAPLEEEEGKYIFFSGIKSNTWFNGIEDKIVMRIYSGYERTVAGTSKLIEPEYDEDKKQYSIFVDNSENKGEKDIFYRFVISDSVGNEETIYIAYPKNPTLNFVKAEAIDSNPIKITPYIIDSCADEYADIWYVLMLEDKGTLRVLSHNMDDMLLTKHKPGDMSTVKIYKNTTYPLYIVPIYEYGNKGKIVGLPYKVCDYIYNADESLNKLEFEIKQNIDINNSICRLEIIVDQNTVQNDVEYSFTCTVDGKIKQTDLNELYFTYSLNEISEATITSYANKGLAVQYNSKTISIDDIFPPKNEKPLTYLYEYRTGDDAISNDIFFEDYNTIKFKSPVVDWHNHLYDTENPPDFQELYISEDGIDFINKGVKISVPVTVNSATDIKYTLDLRTLKYDTHIHEKTGRKDYIGRNCLYGVFTDTLNNTYEGLFTEAETMVCTQPLSFSYSKNKLEILQPNYKTIEGYEIYDLIKGQYEKIRQAPDCRGYIEVFDSDNKWKAPELSEGDNLRWFYSHSYIKDIQHEYNYGKPTYSLTDDSNIKVIRIYSWFSEQNSYACIHYRFLPTYCFKGVTTSLDYATLIKGKNEVTLLRDTDATIPTFIHVMYSNYDYGDDAGLWEIGGYEIASEVVYGPKTIKISDDKNNPNYVPKGMYYTCIAHYADGTTSISDVMKN